MTDIPPAGREAIDYARRGEFQHAIASARRALTTHSQDFGLRVFLAMLHGRAMEFDEALSHLRAANAIDPADEFVLQELVRVLIALGQLEEASFLLNARKSQAAGMEALRAALLLRGGDAGAASKIFQKIVETDPRDFESWGNLGLCLLAMDQPQDALEAFSRSLAHRPDRLSVRYKWAEAHLALGTGEQALVQLYQTAAVSNPTDETIFVAIAHLEALLGRQSKALAALEEAVRRNGASADALSALAEKLEHQNELGRYETILDQLAALPEPGGKLTLLKARLAYRHGDFDSALREARRAPPSMDIGGRAQLIGQCLDKLGASNEAFKAFSEMNSEDARTGGKVHLRAAQSRAELKERWLLLTPEWIDSWTPTPTPDQEPAFLIGFPRSGTTLLDTLLMGHPDIAVAEEEPMLAKVDEKLHHVALLADLTPDEVEQFRHIYFEVAEQHVAKDSAQLLLDKNPLAMGSLAIIHRLFPSAPVLFMERHPCDVVLSCFMTRFQPTGLGTNFLTLETTALLYDQTMQLWTKSAELFPLKLYKIRYERLVEDLEGEIRPLADFLGLDWRPELIKHRETAKKRSFIKTPSYAQVTEPVTNAAVNRWTRYRDEMKPVLSILEPWIHRMGYEL